MKKALIVAAALSLTSLGSAATFTANGGAGTSTVGAGGDYTTLAAAAADFSGPQAVTGNVTFEITSDLTEPANSYFGKATNGFTVTIKPADGVSPTISFTKTNDNSGASGNLIIGASADGTNWGATLVKTDGFTIDGANNLGNRQLTISSSGVTHSFQSLITILGDSDNVKVRNARIINPSTGTGGSIGGIRIATRHQTIAPAGTWIPDGFEIVNNEISAVNASQGVGINMSGSTVTGFAAGVGNSNWLVRNNDIDARIRGIFINQGLANSTIDNNRMTIGATGGNSGFAVAALHVNTANSPPANTFTVSNNRIFVTSNNSASGGNGPSGLILGTMGSGSDRICNVYNNMIQVALTSTNANTASVYRGIWASSGIAYRFFNNSIYMPGSTNHTGPTSLTYFGIGGWAATVGNEAQFSNNLIRIGQAGMAGIMRDTTAAAIGAGFVSNNNVITPSGGAQFGRFQSTNYATQAAWNGATGQDAGSNDTFDPVTSTGSAWSLSPAGNLAFAPNNMKPVGIPGFAPVTSPVNVSTDFQGEVRFTLAGESYPGADELPGLPLPVSVSAFSVD